MMSSKCTYQIFLQLFEVQKPCQSFGDLIKFNEIILCVKFAQHIALIAKMQLRESLEIMAQALKK